MVQLVFGKSPNRLERRYLRHLARWQSCGYEYGEKDEANDGEKEERVEAKCNRHISLDADGLGILPHERDEAGSRTDAEGYSHGAGDYAEHK